MLWRMSGHGDPGRRSAHGHQRTSASGSFTVISNSSGRGAHTSLNHVQLCRGLTIGDAGAQPALSRNGEACASLRGFRQRKRFDARIDEVEDGPDRWSWPAPSRLPLTLETPKARRPTAPPSPRTVTISSPQSDAFRVVFGSVLRSCMSEGLVWLPRGRATSKKQASESPHVGVLLTYKMP